MKIREFDLFGTMGWSVQQVGPYSVPNAPALLVWKNNTSQSTCFGYSSHKNYCPFKPNE